MSNSIIDQQRDNADFMKRRSPYNGKAFVRDFITQNWPDEFYQPDPDKPSVEVLLADINKLLKMEDYGMQIKPIGLNGPFKKMPINNS